MASIKTREDQAAPAAVPLPTSGILMPHKANQFRIAIQGNKIMTMQTTRVLIDMKNQLITHWVEQPAGFAKDLLIEIQRIANRFNVEFSVDLLDGNDGISSSIKGYMKVMSHEFDLDYALGGVAVHKLVYKYEATAV